MLMRIARLTAKRSIIESTAATVSIEYALMAVLIAVAIVGTVGALGTTVAGLFGPLLAVLGI